MASLKDVHTCKREWSMNRCYSRGNIQAKLMMIGEAPGRDEVGHKVDGISMPIPFCGPSGRLLHEIMRWLDIHEGEFILTNVIKSGVFDSKGYTRTPTEEEMLGTADTTTGGREELIEEIRKVDPGFIILLGKVPLWTLSYYHKFSFDNLRITELNGKIHILELHVPVIKEGKAEIANRKIPMLPIYHPAAMLRDRNDKRGYKQQVCKALLKHREMISDVLGRIMI